MIRTILPIQLSLLINTIAGTGISNTVNAPASAVTPMF